MSPGRKPAEKVKTLHLQHLTNSTGRHKLNFTMNKSLIATILTSLWLGVANAAITLPYVNSFDDQSQFDQMTAVNGDGGNSSWKYNNQSANRSSMSSVANDWLLTPEIALKPGAEYQLKFKAWSSANNYINKIHVKIGKGPDTKTYTTELCDVITVDRKDTPKNIDLSFSIDEEGDYRIGIQLTETVFFGGIFVDDIEITQAKAPSAAKMPETTVTPGEKGALSATISVVAPTLLTDESPITAISKIVVKRDNLVIGTADNPTPGQTYNFEDKGEGMTDGFQTYTAAAYVGATEGLSSLNRIWIGKDEAKAPEKFIITDNADGSAHARWELPATGVHDGHVDPATISYKIYQKSVDGDKLLTTVKGPSTEYDFNLGLPDNFNGQQMVVFTISSLSGENESTHTESNEYIVGKPYSLPLYESFPDCQPEAGIWIVHSGEYDWSTVSDVNYDDDNGAVYMSVRQGTDSYTNSIESGKIDLSEAEHPGLVFRYVAYPGSDVQLKVLVRENGGSEYKSIKTINFKELTGEEGEWQNEYVNLSDYKNSKFITVSFEATVADYTKAAVVDAIEVRNVVEREMRIKKATVPESVAAGRYIKVSTLVENVGLKDDEGGKITVTGGSSDVEVVYPAMKALTTVRVDAMVPTSSIAESADLKIKIGDNVFDAGNVELTSADLTAPANLTATEGEKVTLTWEAVIPEASQVNDDFESYPQFTISEFSPWTAIDRDMLPSTALGGTYPHKGEAYPFIIFNPEAVGIPLEGAGSAFKPYSGKQFLAAVAGNGDNDDWLISEELSGDAQTVSLMARSYNTQYGAEKLEVLYSDGSTNPDDFKTPDVEYDFAVPAAWTKYEIAIPEGAKRFALHYKSGFNWMLMIDDITYTQAAPVVEGYNIYRNNTVIARVDASQTSFADENAENGNNKYNVTALYKNIGESALSNTADIDHSGISELFIDNPDCNVVIYNAMGAILFEGELSQAKGSLPRGVYIAVVGNKAFKLAL